MDLSKQIVLNKRKQLAMQNFKGFDIQGKRRGGKQPETVGTHKWGRH